MALKRKRSTTLLSSPLSNTTASSPPSSSSPIPLFYTANKPVTPLPSKANWPSSFYTFEPSRTRKRHRDDRPAEALIHGQCWIGAVIQMSTLADVCRVAASTINRLYQAQRERPQVEPVVSCTATQQEQQIGASAAQEQRSTLHRFWKIEQPPVANGIVDLAMMGNGTAMDAPGHARCEDCDGGLQSDDAMDLDGSWGEKTCYSCRRSICDSCAVLGDERVCMACAHIGHMG